MMMMIIKLLLIKFLILLIYRKFCFINNKIEKYNICLIKIYIIFSQYPNGIKWEKRFDILTINL